MTRWDETWHRLRDWTNQQGPSERLAAQVLACEGFEGIDPSHPLGGPDGGRDAVCTRDGKRWVMAVYFPRGQQSFSTIESKFTADLASARKHSPHGLAFVTNQELTLAERERLRAIGDEVTVELYHLERITVILDQPAMAPVRKQFLDIDTGPLPIAVELDIDGAAGYFTDEETAILLEDHLEDGAEEAREQRHRELQMRADPLAQLRTDFLGRRHTEPPTAEQLERRIERWRQRMHDTWTDCVDHLAATAWPGLRFRVRNVGEVFLNDVQIIITMHGVRGLTWQRPEDFDYDKLLPPVTEAAQDWPVPPIPGDLRPYRPEYPVTWRNIADGVEVTLDLKHLRPHPPWHSDDDDLVLVLQDTEQATAVTAEWTVTAQGYGTAYHGTARTIPLREMPMYDSLRAVQPDDGTDEAD